MKHVSEPTTAASLIHRVQGGFLAAAGYTHALNGYVGCGHTCDYCYAASMVSGQEPKDEDGAPLPWGRWTKPKHGAYQRLSGLRESLSGARVYMSPSTDPYTPQERRELVTQDVLRALIHHHGGVRLLVQTRSPLVTRDTDLLLELHRLGQVQVNMTVSTDSEERKRRLEPASPALERRLSAAGELISAGVPVTVTVTPFLGLEDPGAFLARLNTLGVRRLVVQAFHDDQLPESRAHGTPNLDARLGTLGLNVASLRREQETFTAQARAAGFHVGENDLGFALEERTVNPWGALFA